MKKTLSLSLAVLAVATTFAVADAQAHRWNPPGPRGGPGTNWHNPPGPRGGPGENQAQRPALDEACTVSTVTAAANSLGAKLRGKHAMNYVEAVATCYSKYATFSGRATRSSCIASARA